MLVGISWKQVFVPEFFPVVVSWAHIWLLRMHHLAIRLSTLPTGLTHIRLLAVSLVSLAAFPYWCLVGLRTLIPAAIDPPIPILFKRIHAGGSHDTVVSRRA